MWCCIFTKYHFTKIKCATSYSMKWATYKEVQIVEICHYTKDQIEKIGKNTELNASKFILLEVKESAESHVSKIVTKSKG